MNDPTNSQACMEDTYGLIGQSAAIEKANAQIIQAAQVDTPVLVLGEPGTGKNRAARGLHALGGRQQGPLVRVSWDPLLEGALESDFFAQLQGHHPNNPPGAFDRAQGGTLVLDHIGALSAQDQTRLLHLLQAHVLEPTHGRQKRPIAVRLIATTRRKLLDMIKADLFRADLFYRLQGHLIALPPLRQRLEDVPLLVAHFARLHTPHIKGFPPIFSTAALAALQAYDWPDNVRELEALVQRAVNHGGKDLIEPEDIRRVGLVVAGMP